jgi:integrase
VGTVFRKQVTRPLPPGAEIFVRKGERFGRWKDRRGKTRTAPLTVGKDGSDRIVTESPFYVAKYRDGGGVVRVEPTGCRDETAARQVLADLERRVELVRSNVLTAAEAALADHQGTPLLDHIRQYVEHLEAAGCSTEHVANVNRQLRRFAEECRFVRLGDLDRNTFERWLNEQTKAGMGARTRNSYLVAAIAFANWCSVPTNGRLPSNPFDRMAKLNEKADPRRRRAMTEDELTRLLDVARRRPLLDASTVRRGKRKGERYANLRTETIERLERLGWERALIYKALVLSGLRKGELASLAVAQPNLDGPECYAELAAADEKNREWSYIPIRDDLAADLREWLAAKLAVLQGEARRVGGAIPVRLPPDAKVFDVPEKLSKILNRDLRLAEIAKRDERGHVLDVHALRHTFGTMMSKGGIAPRTAQAAMRHSKLEVTMGVYTDPKLLDVHGALDVLPQRKRSRVGMWVFPTRTFCLTAESDGLT